MLLKHQFIFLCNFNVICLIVATNTQMQLYQKEVRELSELPMEKLIRIKNTFGSDDTVEDSDDKMETRSAITLPIALPLRKNNNRFSMLRRGDYWEEKGKDTKISKIFQLAITTLAFLAFGGYLLALVVSSIRRNAAPTNPGNVIVFSNLESLTKYKRPKRRVIISDPMENEFNTDRLYRGMIMLSEGYASYNR